MNEIPVDPFNDGNFAREVNIHHTANPYPVGCHYFNEWKRGWENADAAISSQGKQPQERRPKPEK